MYKFTNGIVVFDKKTRDRYVKVGYKLANCNKEEINITETTSDEVNENTSNSGAIETKSRRNKKTSK